MELTPIEVLSYGAAFATLYGYFAKTMVPLRVAAIVVNVLFIGYGFGKEFYVTGVLHAVLLPINVKRLRQMLRRGRRDGPQHPPLRRERPGGCVGAGLPVNSLGWGGLFHDHPPPHRLG